MSSRFVNQEMSEPETDEAQRASFTGILLEQLRTPAFRRIEGFPQASDENILSASDLPFYTACPNPFISDFIKRYGKPYDARAPFHKEPYTGKLASSSRHPVYSFHPYHTKVPPEVIRALIEQYTEPGDLVLDGFGGSGMTGVAAREAGRHAILSDLSPVAAFISGVNCRSHDWRTAVEIFDRLISSSEESFGHLYLTNEQGQQIPLNYCIWSDVFTCPECAYEFPFFPHAVIHHGNKVETRKSFPCPNCGAMLSVRRVERVLTREGKKRVLVWVNAGTGQRRVSRAPEECDFKLARQVAEMTPAAWYPLDNINPDGYSARLAQLGDKAITDVSRFLSRRNLIIFADLWQRVSEIEDASLRHLCRATLTSIFTVISERQGYFGGGGGMSGNLYMPIVRMEKNIYDTLRRKLSKLADAERAKEKLTARVIVSTQSATCLSSIPDASIDYIYTDPPFGANIIYSEMNLMLEAWLQVRTDDRQEAVIDNSRGLGFAEYARLMRRCFSEYFRVLKPGRWLTVEFHNTSAGIWNLIQTAIGESGFVIAQVGVFDKGSTTILGDIRPGAAKHDLVISAYRPTERVEKSFKLEAATEAGIWEFVSAHLQQLPVCANSEDEIAAERTSHLLFDKMLAFHVQGGIAVLLSASEFYAGLKQRFAERDGMYFLPEQVAEYDRRRAAARE
jgi:DNA modification methylase